MSNEEDDRRQTSNENEGLIERVRRALELTEGVEIARRYMAMNAFDGALTMLGLILGGLFTIDSTHPEVSFAAVLLAASGATVAMTISGFSGSYLAERAERDREVQDIGRAMLRDMSDTMYARASKTTSIVVALVDGASPAVTALIVLSPLLLVPIGVLNYYSAFEVAIVMCLVLLYLLGVFLGHVSRKNVWKYGLRTLTAGVITAILMLLIAFATGEIA
ncbi:MAG: VIT1/CCC1 transporter family protein [Candidatus Thorarchaeota archaeon]|nr:VIT1/CCC1 transporter family protein [Candidatus Thorarchaeota archaeon]